MIPNYTDPRRGTGRTTRAVKHAIELAESGKGVLFACEERTWRNVAYPMLMEAATAYGSVGEFYWQKGFVTLVKWGEFFRTGHAEEYMKGRAKYDFPPNYMLDIEWVVDHYFAETADVRFRNNTPFLHAYDHDNREIPALPSPAKARQWLCSLEVEFAWKPALGADLALMALKDAQDAEVRIVLLDAMDRWTRGGV